MYSKKSGKSIFKKFLCTAGSVIFVTLFGGLTAQAQEITVQNGDIQAALNQAQSESEVLTVVIPQGEYNVSGVLFVYSDTIIKADGAVITSTSSASGQTLLTNAEGASNVTVQGGTWVSNVWSPLQFQGMSNSVLDHVTASTSAEYAISLLNNCTGITIQNSKLQGGGIYAEGSSGINILKNEITDAKTQGIRVYATGNNLVQGNTVTNSGQIGIQLESDTNSIVDDNTIIGSAVSGVGEGLVAKVCNGTKLTNNRIHDTHTSPSQNGNGIIASESTNVLIDRNKVVNAGNHGIQVTDSSIDVTVSNNEISGSGRMGISISRGVRQVSIEENTISASKVNGIVFDGSNGRCSGTVDGGTVLNSQGAETGDGGIWIGASNVAVQNVTVADGAGHGMVIAKGSDVTALDNYIYQTSEAAGRDGIAVYDNSTAALDGNCISNFGRSGIKVWSGTVTAANNTVTSTSPTGCSDNAIDIPNTIMNNKLTNPAIAVDHASGGNYYNGVEAGVVINGALISTVIPEGGGGKFTVEYPAQPDTSGIVLYVKNNTDGNVICVNAPNGFTLNGTHTGNPGNEIDEERVGAFVTRLYQNVLGRPSPDPKEVQFWVDELAKGETGAKVAYGFFFSDEFINKGLGNSEYVDILYQTMFGQAGDAAGRDLWIGEMETGFSRLYIYHGFAESVQFGNLCQEYGIQRGNVDLTEPRDLNRNLTQFVSRNYRAALGRTPDAGGLNDWCRAILDGTFKPEAVVDHFIFSPEFESKGLSDGEFVDTLYATYFDRPADAGRETWMNVLANGGSRRDVVAGFSGADEFHRLVASFNLPQ